MRLFLFLFSFLILLSGCKENPPVVPPEEYSLILKVEDVSCTEAWLYIKGENLNNLNLYRDDSLIAHFNTAVIDTVYIDEGLLPNQTYLYKATTLVNNKIISSEAAALTMDTTSHNFTWQTWTFGGEVGSSTLYDVAIINENNIWAVGEIYMKDSLGNPDPKAYNAVHWDGVKWELKRIPSIICGNNTIIFRAIYSIYAFGGDNIFFTDGGEIIYFNGETYKQDCSINPLLTGKINKLWGTSSSDLYAVGNNGNIAHYNGTKWTKIESETDLDIYSIWGTQNKENDFKIYTVAAKQGINADKKIFELNNNSITELPVKGIPFSINAIWFKPSRKYYIAGSGIFTKYDINSNFGWKSIWQGITEYYTYSIDGNDLNDIVICGSYGELLHWNGISWKSFQNELSISAGSFRSIKIKNNLVVSVGYDLPEAIITIGRK
jgi:hypothetical protein